MEICPCKRRKTTEEDRESEAWMSRIPDQILVELLIRAFRNSKFATKCRLVCKRWDSIISSRYFIKRCAAHHRRKLKSFTLLFQWSIHQVGFPVIALCPKGSGIVHHLNLDFIPSKNQVKVTDSVLIKASCHDLLLLTYLSDYYVVNPKIRQWIALPSPPTTPGPPTTFFKDAFLCEFNYCNGLRFKVMRIVFVTTSDLYPTGRFSRYCGNIKEFNVQIYCSESKRWSEYTIDWYPIRLTHYLTRTPIISHKGMFHWLNGHSIVSLNPFDLVVDDDVPSRLRPNRTVELPVKNLLAPDVCVLLVVDATSAFNRLMGFGVTSTHLRVITKCFQTDSDIDHPLLVWQLKESKTGPGVGEGLWSLVHKVPYSDLYERSEPFNLLAFHPYQGDVLFVQKCNSIYSLNLRTKKFKEFMQHKPYQSMCWIRYAMPALLHQWLPTQLIPSLLYSPAQ